MENSWLSENLADCIKSDDNILEKCPNIANDIIEKRLRLVNFVERLGDILTDKDPHIRSKGTEVLAEVLQNLPRYFLTEAELHFISTFFLDRLIDHYLVTPAVLKGIVSFVQMGNLPHLSATRVVHSILKHIQCQSLKPEDRRRVYTIFQYLMYNFKEDLQSLGPDFVYGFMTAIDQEKDAQNLVLIFGMIPYFVRTYQLGHLKEEMFEIISCYFPVDYRPDYSNCPVSREDLAEALQNCLVASSDFAEFCLPLLVEKLDSKLKLAKLDSFKVLISGCEVFAVECIRAYLLDLWRIIQHEVLPGSDKEVRELGLAALKAIVKNMSVAAEEMQDTKLLKSVTTLVLSGGINALGEVELNLFLPAVRMMLTVAEASASSCQEVSQKVIPVLTKQYYKEIGTEQKVTVLRALSSFIAVCGSQNILLKDSSNSVSQDISSLFLCAAQFEYPEVRKEGFHGLAVSARIVEENNRNILYDLLKKSLNEEGHASVREEILLCLKMFSCLYSDEVQKRIVEVKLRDIQLWPESGDQDLYLGLKTLCRIADEDPFISLVIPCMLQLIESCLFEKCRVGVKCLRDLLETTTNTKIFTYIYTECDVVSRLTSWWLRGIREDKCAQIFENEDILCDTAKILNIIVKNQDSSAQNHIVSVVVPQVLNFNCGSNSTCESLEFDGPVSSKHTLKVVLLEAILSCIHPDVKIPNFVELVMDLSKLAIYSTNIHTHLSSCRLLANLINKASDDEILLKVLHEVSSKGKAHIDDNNIDFKSKNSVNLFIWVTKALVMRGHSLMNEWVEKLIAFMDKPHMGCIAAQGFSLILKEDVEYFNLFNFCNVRILFRQRFFSFTPKLVEAFHEAHKDVKANYLIALGHMLQGVPEEVLIMDLEKMVPLLVESLQQTDETLLLTTLETLLSVLQKSKLALQHHLQTFIPRILILTRFQNSMKVRIRATQCINQFCKYPTELILPFKKNVLKILGECLDDPKRLVRKEVVLTRSHWFIVGTNGRR